MRRIRRSHLALLVALLAFCGGCIPLEMGGSGGDGSRGASGKLWPEIEPFESGHLRVSELHEIYYELSGNPDGMPVFVLHGGPGGSTSPYMRRFFDPERYLIVLHDQRGAGQSRPPGELRENDTWALVEDIEALREHLELEQVVLFGGSWGSTLGLAYAETHPDQVSALVLRGVFTGTDAEIDHFYHGGAAELFPEAYAALLAELPDPDRRPLPAYLHELISGTEGPERERVCRAWARYEIKMAALNLSDETVERYVTETETCTFSLFENYYMANRCFLDEGQLLDGAGRLAGIPTFIVNGRYDVICPPRAAWELHRRIPGSELIIAEEAGHWMGEAPIEGALVEIFERLAEGS
jgi:proline iminopeptidase